MREKKAACLEREMEQLTTEQLDVLLQNELRKDTPDENVVLPILKVLEERERDDPVEVSYQVRSAWERYQERIKPQQNTPTSRKRFRFAWVAAVAAVLCLVVIAFPFAADADSALDILYRVTDSIVEFFRPGENPTDTDGEYIFETDNPDLQQLYDVVVEMGITDPVVPMWLPEGYALEELYVTPNPVCKKLHASFRNSDDSIVIQISHFQEIMNTQFEQDDRISVYHAFGNEHFLFDNNDYLSAVWFHGNFEGLINATESEDTMYNIIDSIYRRR